MDKWNKQNKCSPADVSTTTQIISLTVDWAELEELFSLTGRDVVRVQRLSNLGRHQRRRSSYRRHELGSGVSSLIVSLIASVLAISLSPLGLDRSRVSASTLSSRTNSC